MLNEWQRKYNELRDAIRNVLDSEDSSGCSDDLTVVSFDAIEKVRDVIISHD